VLVKAQGASRRPSFRRLEPMSVGSILAACSSDESAAESSARTGSKVAEAGGMDDLCFACSDSPLSFEKWRGALAMAVRAELPPPGVYLTLGLAHSELMHVVVEAIEPSFDVVVRSAR
jgi:hypothetical protein